MKPELESKKSATLFLQPSHTSPLLDNNLPMWQTDITYTTPGSSCG